MVTCGWDVLTDYAALYPGKVRRFAELPQEKELPQVAQKPVYPDNSGFSDRKKEKKPIDKDKAQSYSDIRNTLTGEDQLIFSVLQKGDCLFDDVVAKTGLPAAKVMSALTLLQIKGIVTKKPGNILSLK